MADASAGKAPEVILQEPDNGLRRKLGDADLSMAFTPEKIKACDAIIEKAQEDFFEEILPEMDKLSTMLKRAQASGDTEVFLQGVETAADAIRGRASALGYSFIAQVSAHLIAICEENATLTPRHYAMLAHLTEALELAFREKMRCDGGEQGRELLKSLQALR